MYPFRKRNVAFKWVYGPGFLVKNITENASLQKHMLHFAKSKCPNGLCQNEHNSFRLGICQDRPIPKAHGVPENPIDGHVIDLPMD